MKRGFTLIELLGVIALLGILSLVSIPIIDNSINSSRDSLDDVQEKQIIKAAQDYYAEHLSELNCSSISCTKTVSFSTLQDGGYLSYNIINESTSKVYSRSSYVQVTITKSTNSSGEITKKIQYKVYGY